MLRRAVQRIHCRCCGEAAVVAAALGRISFYSEILFVQNAEQSQGLTLSRHGPNVPRWHSVAQMATRLGGMEVVVVVMVVTVVVVPSVGPRQSSNPKGHRPVPSTAEQFSPTGSQHGRTASGKSPWRGGSGLGFCAG